MPNCVPSMYQHYAVDMLRNFASIAPLFRGSNSNQN
jgi:hypothetical protein